MWIYSKIERVETIGEVSWMHPDADVENFASMQRQNLVDLMFSSVFFYFAMFRCCIIITTAASGSGHDAI